MTRGKLALCVIAAACFGVGPASAATDLGAATAATPAEQGNVPKPVDPAAAASPAATSPPDGVAGKTPKDFPRDTFDAKRSQTLGVCLYHGTESSWKGLLPGVENGFTVKLNDAPLDKKFLSEIGILIIPGCNKGNQFGKDEIELVSDFVSSGGGLLCATQAWSWVDTHYGNKPIASFPINPLGRSFGFMISGRAVGHPVPTTADPVVFGAIKNWSAKSKWAPSDVLPLFNSKVKILLRDPQLSPLILSGEHGAGRFVVAGHDGLFADNPEAFKAVLHFLKPN
jgi:hypothetical protein